MSTKTDRTINITFPCSDPKLRERLQGMAYKDFEFRCGSGEKSRLYIRFTNAPEKVSVK